MVLPIDADSPGSGLPLVVADIIVAVCHRLSKLVSRVCLSALAVSCIPLRIALVTGKGSNAASAHLPPSSGRCVALVESPVEVLEHVG